jgi:hypothetical protein
MKIFFLLKKDFPNQRLLVIKNLILDIANQDPAKETINALINQQIELIDYIIQSQKKTNEIIDTTNHYMRYTSLESTKKVILFLFQFIKKNRPKKLSMSKALFLVDYENSLALKISKNKKNAA